LTIHGLELALTWQRHPVPAVDDEEACLLLLLLLLLLVMLVVWWWSTGELVSVVSR
jgi:hypothetical protein